MNQGPTDVGSVKEKVTLKTREETEQMIRDCSEKLAQLFEEKNWKWGPFEGKKAQPPTKEEIEKAWFSMLTSAEKLSEEGGENSYRMIGCGRLGAHYSKERGYTLFLHDKPIKSAEDLGDGVWHEASKD